MDWAPGAEGVFLNLADEIYRTAPGANQSMLKHVGPTMAHMIEVIRNPRPSKPTPAKFMGTLVHSMILRPDDPLPKVAVRPQEFAPGSKEMRGWLKEQRASGTFVLDADEWEIVNGCVRGVASNQKARMLFCSGDSEVSLFGNLRDLKNRPVWCKARIDWLPYGNVIPDVKTTTDVDAEAFAWEIKERGYHVQAAWYLDLYESLRPWDRRDAFALVAVEKRAPYVSRVFNLSERAIALGRRTYKQLLTRYLDCLEAVEWPSYPNEITPLDLPERAYAEQS